MPGIIESYIHTGNSIGVLVEVGCQSNIGARTSELKSLAKNIAMQIAACPEIKYIRIADIPTEITKSIETTEMSRKDLSKKPANIRNKVVRERIESRLKEICLLERDYIREQEITVQDLIKLHDAQLSEDIQVRRFVRFQVDESENPLPPDSDWGVPNKPLPNSPDPLISEAEFE